MDSTELFPDAWNTGENLLACLGSLSFQNLRFPGHRGERSVQFFPLPAEGNTDKPRQKGVEVEGSGVG